MASLFDYVQWRGDLGFDQSPFNPVDNIIFSQLAYLPMEEIVSGPGERSNISIAEAAALYTEKQGDRSMAKDVIVAEAESVINAIESVPRYKDCKISDYVNNIDLSQEKQFAAYCVIIGKKRSERKMLVVYRGTDMSIVGWKEDLKMSLSNSIPSQKEAVSYLEKIATQFPYPLMIAGHSKGGNLAIYASAFCTKDTQKRITAIYSNDAPGFHKQVILSKGYQAICGRIQAFIPQSALVGMLFEHGETPMVVKSTAIGLLQHSLCSWEVTYNNIANAGELSQQSRIVDNIIREWIYKIDEGQRQQFIEAVYAILVSGNANSLTDLTIDWKNTAVSIIKALKNMDKPTKKLMSTIIADLFKAARKSIKGQQSSFISRIFPSERGQLPEPR